MLSSILTSSMISPAGTAGGKYKSAQVKCKARVKIKAFASSPSGFVLMAASSAASSVRIRISV